MLLMLRIADARDVICYMLRARALRYTITYRHAMRDMLPLLRYAMMVTIMR